MAQKAVTDSEILSEIEKNFVGTWQCTASENFEELLKEMEIPYLMRKVAVNVKPDCVISIVDGTVRIAMVTTMKTEQEDLDFEKEVEREKMAGKVKVRTSFEDGKIVQLLTPIDSKKKQAKCTRKIEDGKLALIWETGKVTGTRTFSRKQ